MIALTTLAMADPGAFRADGNVAVELGGPSVSVAVDIPNQFRMAGWIRLDGGSVGVISGFLSEGKGATRVVGGLGAGVIAQTWTRGVAVHGNGSLGFAHRMGAVDARLSVVVPVSVAVYPKPEVRLPVLAEGALTFRLSDRVSVGGRGALGAIVGVWRPSAAVQGGAFVTVRRRAE